MSPVLVNVEVRNSYAYAPDLAEHIEEWLRRTYAVPAKVRVVVFDEWGDEISVWSAVVT